MNRSIRKSWLAGWIGLLIGALQPAFATDYFVATDGDDANDGLTLTSAWRTLTFSVHAIQGGDRLFVRGGTYREAIEINNHSGSATQPMLICAWSNEIPVIKGSEVVTNWVHHQGNVWKITNRPVQNQQVFADGKLLNQLGWPNQWQRDFVCSPNRFYTLPFGYSILHIDPVTHDIDIGEPETNMPPNSFFYDEEDQTLYVHLADGSSPIGKFMEVSIHPFLINDRSVPGYITFKGFHFRHQNSFTPFSVGGVMVGVGQNGAIVDCDIQWGDNIGALLRAGSTAQRCNISNHGKIGVFVPAIDNFLLTQSTVYSNNYRDVNFGHTGGLRAIPFAGGVIESNVFAWNYASAIWFDTCDDGKRKIIRNNHIHNNCLHPNRPGDHLGYSTSSIFIEFSDSAEIYNNLIEDNCNNGITLSGSRNCRIFNNTIVGTRATPGGTRGLAAFKMFNALDQRPVANNWFYNNLVLENITDWDFQFSPQNPFDTYDNFIDHNLIYGSTGSSVRFRELNSHFDLASWSAETGFGSNSISLPAMTNSNYTLTSNSLAIDAGLATAMTTTDMNDVPRPLDGNQSGVARIDIGAFEFVPPGQPFLYVDASATNPLPPFASRQTAAARIEDAVALAGPGQVVLVAPGHYLLTNTISLTNGVKLQSLAGKAGTILDGRDAVRCVEAAHSNAIVDGFTITRGYAVSGGGGLITEGATIQNSCIVSNRADQNGGGLMVQSRGRVLACTIGYNVATNHGGGLFLSTDSVASNCTAEWNMALGKGGGVYLETGARLLDSRVNDNDAPEAGGVMAGADTHVSTSELLNNNANLRGGGAVVSGAIIEKCRIQNNNAGEVGGGVSVGGAASVVNCLILDNLAPTGGGVLVQGGQLVNCTVADNTAQTAGGVWVGSTGLVVNTIIYFNQATSEPNYNLPASGNPFSFCCASPPPPGANNVGAEPAFKDRAAGDYRIPFGSPCVDAATPHPLAMEDILLTTRPFDGDGDANRVPDIGCYEFKNIRFVSASVANIPVYPYWDFTSAARSLADGIRASWWGDVIVVAPGTYRLVANIVAGRSLLIKSVAGPASTILDGQGLTRVLFMAQPAAVVDGFTIRNGVAEAGGGVYFDRVGTVRNCIIENCTSTADLGGEFYYTYNWTNQCTAARDARIHEGGGGVLFGNGGVLENSVVVHNNAVYGGGIVGVDGGIVKHCTIVSNSADIGGGLYAKNASNLQHSIVFHNTGTNGPNYFNDGPGFNTTYTATTPLPPGMGNRTNDPLLITTGVNAWRPGPGSPAIDAAVDLILDVDLFGVPRPLDGDNDQTPRPDLGAFEVIHPSADSDQDLLNDVDELVYGTDPLSADSDGDRSYDGNEVIAQTDPLDRNSYLAMLTPEPTSSNTMVIRWTSEPGVLYSLSYTTNLVEFGTVIQSNIPATPPINVFVDNLTSNDARRFYRVEVDH
ncbi:MAG: right-handed parallel beta-helix repeat-containing protein [Verrucomicrobiota bacterium]